MTRHQLRHVVLVPLAAWAALGVAIVATCLYANWPHGPQKAAVTLLIAAAQALVSGVLFMRLDQASPLVRFAAVSGFVWLSYLFIFAFADYLTRAYPF
ncbi:MAG: hypothetical protein ACREEW_12925 [Caulobacteraceae bacterium]